MCLAGPKEKVLKKKLKLCKDVDGACKDYEDKSMVYIASCKTSTNALNTTLKVLYQAQEYFTNVSLKTAEIANLTGSNNLRNNELMESVTQFTIMSNSVDLDQIGLDSTIRELALNISTTSVNNMTFTSDQISTAETLSITMNKITEDLAKRLTEVQTMLVDLTGLTMRQP